MRYVVMVKDELGEDSRAYGSPALEKVYEYPAIDWEDEIAVDAFYYWKNRVEDKLQEEWENIYGPESRIFLEREYSDMSLSEWRALGYGTDDFGFNYYD